MMSLKMKIRTRIEGRRSTDSRAMIKKAPMTETTSTMAREEKKMSTVY